MALATHDRIFLEAMIIHPCTFSGELRESPNEMVYRFRGFKCPKCMVMDGFEWGLHIEQSFYNCMKPMTDKFMKVV